MVNTRLTAIDLKVYADAAVREIDDYAAKAIKMCDLGDSSFEWSHILESDFSSRIRAAEDFVVLEYGPEFYGQWSVAEINNRLRILWLRFRQCQSPSVLQEIKKLVGRLHAILSVNFKLIEQNLRKRIKNLLAFLRLTVKKCLRSIISFIFKYYSDFSGSEEGEEVAAYKSVGGNFFKLQNSEKDESKNSINRRYRPYDRFGRACFFSS